MTALPEVYDPDDGSAKDYVVAFRVRNGPMLRAIRARGWTVKRLGEMSGVNLGVIHRYLSLRYAPINKHGEWKRSALKLAKALHTAPDLLFPEQHLQHALAKNSGELDVSIADVQALFIGSTEVESIEDQTARAQLYDTLAQQVERLPPRSRDILRARFGLDGESQTLQEIADRYAVGPARVRQIEQKALKMLRHPIRSNELRERGAEEEIASRWHYASDKARFYKVDWDDAAK